MHNKKRLKEILEEVPPDYYQKGVKNNLLQKLWHTGKLKAVMNFIIREPKKILDVGCASGWFLNKVSENCKDAKCYGVDAYRDAILYGKKQYKFLQLKHADAHNLSYPSQTFDLVLCTEVLEHVSNPKLVLKEIKRVLTKNGIAIIEMDSGSILFNLIWYWWTHMRNGVWKQAHLHLFNANKLEKLIKKSGFLIIDKKFFNFGMAVLFKVKIL